MYWRQLENHVYFNRLSRLHIITKRLRHSGKQRCHYEVLGVEKTATATEIKQAFYTKSKEVHPDNIGPGDADAFVELKRAYDVLKRPADRRLYDLGDTNRLHGPGFQHTYHYANPSHYTGPGSRSGRKMSKSMEAERAARFWKFVRGWSIAGFVIVVLYNFGYWYQLHLEKKRIDKLVDEDEIARSYLRMFKNSDHDTLEMGELGRLFKGDVDEAWRRRSEELGKLNKDEIREEYRWFRAVQDPEHILKIKKQRAYQRQREIDERWGRIPVSPPATST